MVPVGMMEPAPKPTLLLQRTALWLVCGIIITIPLLFGAVHPLVSGIYVCLMLVGCGGWLLLTMQPGKTSLLSPWTLVPVLADLLRCPADDSLADRIGGIPFTGSCRTHADVKHPGRHGSAFYHDQ